MMFSIIIPTYNRPYLTKIAIESVLQQTFSDFELIVVDDGSDNSFDELSKFEIRDSRLKIIRHEKNFGVSAARNTGIKAASGEWICFLDSDDRFLKDKLEKTKKYIEQFPEYSIFHTQEVWYSNNKLLKQKKKHKKPDGDFFEQSLKLCCVGPSTVCIKRSLFHKYGYFDETLLSCEDYDLWLRFSISLPIKLIPHALTIKQGGHKDQLSAQHSLDKYRIISLNKLLKSKTINKAQTNLAKIEYNNKLNIYTLGCWKNTNPEGILELLKPLLNIKFNLNSKREMKRLIFELMVLNKLEHTIIIEIIGQLMQCNLSGKDKIQQLKTLLIIQRFPMTSKNIGLQSSHVYLPELQDKQQNIYHPTLPFTPESIYVENEVKNCELQQNIQKMFPKIKIKYLDKYSQAIDQLKPSVETFKKPHLFIIKEHHDFLKACPCTKKHLGCGYWILNLGFGCPFDCSYCYLQQYQNVPGILLPANLDDFLNSFDNFYKKINKTIRIGTGEFCDSLALDHITNYSKKLVPFFANKNVLFELKTKSNNIENLLSMPGAKNIVISWSLNPQSFIDKEELAVASLLERLKAAQKIQQHGYSIAFHFDPIVPFDTWKSQYTEVIDMIYDNVKPHVAWISLGTLRFTREMKGFMEQRFQESKIVYGELLLGDDKKLRYPEFMRTSIYKHMQKQIRKHDKHSPIYLCMESKKIWEQFLPQSNTTTEVEKMIIKKMPT